MTRTRILGLAAFIAVVGAGGAEAAEVQVKMLNKGSSGAIMVFEPALVRIAPGDTVRFLPTDKGHDAVSVPGMIPDGATPFEGKMNQEIAITFEKEGAYGVKCKPHYGLGMVALIVVGEPVNLEAAKAAKHPGKAKQAFLALFDQLAAGN